MPALWSEVNRYGQNGDFTRALKTVNKSKCQGGRWGGPGRRKDAGSFRRARPPLSRRGGAKTQPPVPGSNPRAAAVAWGRGSGCQKPTLGLGVFRATCTSLLTPLGKRRRDLKRPLLPAPHPNCLFSPGTPLFSRLISQISPITFPSPVSRSDRDSAVAGSSFPGASAGRNLPVTRTGEAGADEAGAARTGTGSGAGCMCTPGPRPRRRAPRVVSPENACESTDS